VVAAAIGPDAILSFSHLMKRCQVDVVLHCTHAQQAVVVVVAKISQVRSFSPKDPTKNENAT
jgi:hypothetical protein